MLRNEWFDRTFAALIILALPGKESRKMFGYHTAPARLAERNFVASLGNVGRLRQTTVSGLFDQLTCPLHVAARTTHRDL